MVEAHESHHKKDVWKIILTIWAVLSIIILFGMYQNNKGISSSLTSCYNNQNQNYEYKCSEGSKRECVPINQQVSYCEQGQYNLCYDKDKGAMTYDTIQQTYSICNKVDGVQAQCVSKTASCLTCPSGAYHGCYDSNGKWVSAVYS